MYYTVLLEKVALSKAVLWQPGAEIQKKAITKIESYS